MKRRALAATLFLLAFVTAGLSSESLNTDTGYFHELLIYGGNPYPAPEWILSLEQDQGSWKEQPARWIADATLPDGQGRMVLHLNRDKILNDLGMSLLFDEETSGDVAIQLMDAEGRTVAVDLVGNAVTASDETETFAIPLQRHPTATRIAIQRITGNISVQGIVLFPLLIGNTADTELIDRVDLLRLLKQTLSPDSATYKTIKQVMREKDVQNPTMTTTIADTMSTAPQTTDNTPDRSSTPRNVGIDIFHGKPWEGAVEQLRAKNFNPILIDTPISAQTLSNLDALIITDGRNVSFETNEVAAITAFVQEGGGLLCAGQAWSWSYPSYGNNPIDSYPLNMLGRELGFKITGINVGAPALSSPPFVDHVDEVVRDGWWPSKVLLSHDRAQPFLRDKAMNIIAGSYEYETGRVVVLGHGALPAQNPELLDRLINYLSSP